MAPGPGGSATSSACSYPSSPLRGQIAHLGVAEHDTGAWPIVQQVYGHYMVPWADRRVAVGATVEDAGFSDDVTAGGVNEIMREALRVMPGLASATLGAIRAGLRPTSRDDPHLCLGRPRGSTTSLLGPATVRAGSCSDRSPESSSPTSCRGKEPELDLAPFSPARFRDR